MVYGREVVVGNAESSLKLMYRKGLLHISSQSFYYFSYRKVNVSNREAF